ncbi:DUF7093 family protein [Natrarchaeobius chitinivorans]|uniref:Uncharacterized protein n=1 Tax=Natrarchaeobius chitinivorans TaxID=1679083 RepID=A0A3N6PCD0_NATCH|nr:hypothetical protein [Natrarchaeobius chitinivorans]RQG94415.1 hypothetical protein EA473_11980 [Natrarchaeobius chitinivorans]
MVLRCSLLGHDYGETEVQREREERGSEVVVTVQEFEECARCGERNVISENTEVTSIVTESNESTLTDDDARTPDPEPEPEPTSDHAEPAAEANVARDDPAETDGVIVDADPTDVDPEPDSNQPPAEAESADDIDLPTDENGETITDDGEILESDDSEEPRDGRDRGEWPDSDDVGPPVDAGEEVGSWPDADESADPADAEEPVEDDAIVLEHDESAVGSSSGAEAIATESEILDAAAGADADPEVDSGSGIERAEPAPKPGDTPNARSDDAPTEFYCPRCEYVDAGDRGSLRAGDICPKCRKGYLGERPLQ